MTVCSAPGTRYARNMCVDALYNRLNIAFFIIFIFAAPNDPEIWMVRIDLAFDWLMSHGGELTFLSFQGHNSRQHFQWNKKVLSFIRQHSSDRNSSDWLLLLHKAEEPQSKSEDPKDCANWMSQQKATKQPSWWQSRMFWSMVSIY